MKNDNYQQCSIGLWDTTIPGISFDENGVSNYCKIINSMDSAFPKGDEGRENWEKIIKNVRAKGKNKRYDCIIGVSGGTDSSYMLHLAKKEWNLKPLAVNLDNGWSTDIAVSNIKKVTDALDIDLETYVIDYEEVKSVLRAYIKANLPWIDGPTDLAIKSILYKTAIKEKIKYIFIGDDFRSEGKQPHLWTYSDSKQLKYICKKFEGLSLKSFPYMSLNNFIYFNLIKRIKAYKPFYFLEYKKQNAQKILTQKYDWRYYGGHHHENLFTRFAIAYWQYKKFNIDKRIITLSSQIATGSISKEEAINQIKAPHYDIKRMEDDKKLVIKKLGMDEEEFIKYWNLSNKSFVDYPSYYPFFEKNKKIISFLSKYLLPMHPKILFSDAK